MIGVKVQKRASDGEKEASSCKEYTVLSFWVQHACDQKNPTVESQEFPSNINTDTFENWYIFVTQKISFIQQINYKYVTFAA